jgi:hypothetical protein
MVETSLNFDNQESPRIGADVQFFTEMVIPFEHGTRNSINIITSQYVLHHIITLIDTVQAVRDGQILSYFKRAQNT